MRVGSHYQNSIVKMNIQNLTLGARTLLLYAKIYWPEEITTMILPYSLKDFSEKINELKVVDDGVTPMENFAGTKIYINLKELYMEMLVLCLE